MQPQLYLASDRVPAESIPLALAARAEWLNRRWADATADRIVVEAIELAFRGRIAVVSSFGAEA
ncbi:MAG TPA: hypothetical protein VFG64_05930, partial [Dongiaceae bacterium]|nr:hypothetical protein [Dongiaceae bacterium]